MKWPSRCDRIYGCWSISSDVKGPWLRAGVKTWTSLLLRPSTQGQALSLPTLFYTSLSLSLLHSLSICHLLLFICICMSFNSSRTQNLCIRYLCFYWILISHNGRAENVQLLPSQQHENLKAFFNLIFNFPLKSVFLFTFSRFWAHRHSNTSCRFLRPVTSLPGGAGGRVHCEKQASHSDLSLHSGHADLFQVQWGMGSSGRPLDWKDCRPSYRYTQNNMSPN